MDNNHVNPCSSCSYVSVVKHKMFGVFTMSQDYLCGHPTLIHPITGVPTWPCSHIRSAGMPCNNGKLWQVNPHQGAS